MKIKFINRKKLLMYTKKVLVNFCLPVLMGCIWFTPIYQGHALDLLHRSVIDRDYETVEKILQGELNNPNLTINEVNLDYIKNYRNFIAYRTKSEVQQLIKNVFDEYDVVNLNGWRPLNWAVFNDDLPMVKLLLQYSADPNSLDSIKATPLHWAALWAGIDVIRELVNAGAKYWQRDNLGYTPLYRAIQRESAKQDVGIIKFLINQGAQIDRTDKKGRNAFLVAAAMNNTSALNFLRRLNSRMIRSYDNNGDGPLHWAITAKGNPNNIIVLKNLIGQGAPIDDQNYKGGTPLHLAVFRRNEAAVRYLLEISANPNIQDHLGNTPLHVAAKWGYTDMVNIFFDVFVKGTANRILRATVKGVDPNIKNRDGFAPIQVALYDAHPFTAKEILRFVNVDPTQYDPLGETPFHLAARNNNLDLMDNMIARARKLDKKNFLLIENARRQRVIEVAVEYNDIDLVIYLVQQGGLGNRKDVDINRLFYYARSVRMEKLLLKLKQNPKANLVNQ